MLVYTPVCIFMSTFMREFVGQISRFASDFWTFESIFGDVAADPKETPLETCSDRDLMLHVSVGLVRRGG